MAVVATASVGNQRDIARGHKWRTLYMTNNSDDESEMTSTTTSTTTSSAPAPRRRLFDETTIAEATDALSSVGWSSPVNVSPPADDMTALTSDDPFVRMIDMSVRNENGGIGLDGLLNPAKVVNLERDLYNLRTELASVTGIVLTKSDDGDDGVLATPSCDGGGGGISPTTYGARSPGRNATSPSNDDRSSARG
jgi:hypothetical protein